MASVHEYYDWSPLLQALGMVSDASPADRALRVRSGRTRAKTVPVTERRRRAFGGAAAIEPAIRTRRPGVVPPLFEDARLWAVKVGGAGEPCRFSAAAGAVRGCRGRVTSSSAASPWRVSCRRKKSLGWPCPTWYRGVRDRVIAMARVARCWGGEAEDPSVHRWCRCGGHDRQRHPTRWTRALAVHAGVRPRARTVGVPAAHGTVAAGDRWAPVAAAVGPEVGAASSGSQPTLRPWPVSSPCTARPAGRVTSSRRRWWRSWDRTTAAASASRSRPGPRRR